MLAVTTLLDDLDATHDDRRRSDADDDGGVGVVADVDRRAYSDDRARPVSPGLRADEVDARREGRTGRAGGCRGDVEGHAGKLVDTYDAVGGRRGDGESTSETRKALAEVDT
ncbi:hypothetical protein ABGB16_02665 [Micromonospora sp. B11E3]|uniref:hypothetical protein n=1 Tax=Micromonospora sp. B11E3 TaxID=3153562 RepID=UPI00325CF899